MISKKRFLRYLAPNLVTFAGVLFGTLSILASVEGLYARAGWFIVFTVLTDKLDGIVARKVKGTSEFGVQMDSFSDFLSFGIAPATLFYAFLSHMPGLSFEDGLAHAALVVACFVWVLGVTFRLARFNVVADDPTCQHVFFGVPTTLMGGVLVALLLSFVKYGTPETQVLAHATFDEPRMFGGLTVGWLGWELFPVFIAVGALLMASALPIPKLSLARNRALGVFVLANVLAGYVFGFARRMPEYLCFAGCVYLVPSLVWGQCSKRARGLKVPPIFPPEDQLDLALVSADDGAEAEANDEDDEDDELGDSDEAEPAVTR